MKVKINKILPYHEQIGKKYKGVQPFQIDGQPYILSPNKIQQRNFVGFLISYQFIMILPDPNSEYDYFKVEIRVENTDFKQHIHKISQVYSNIRKNDNRKELLFEFVPPFKGGYTISLDCSYKVKYVIQTTQPPQEKRESMKANIVCQEVLQIAEKVVCEQKSQSISFPLLVQYTIINKIPDEALTISYEFDSPSFLHKFLNDSPFFTLEPTHIYYIMAEIMPKSVAILNQKGVCLGSLKISYGEKGKMERKTFLKNNNKMIFFRGQSINKTIKKKDIEELTIKFSKTFNYDFKLGQIRIQIDEKQLPAGIKILKLSKNKIDLSHVMSEELNVTMISLRSGYFRLTGLNLCIRDHHKESEDRSVKFVNDICVMVENGEMAEKEGIFDKTQAFQLQIAQKQESLI